MFEHHKKHKRGWKTMLFLYIKHGWLLNIIALAILALGWLIYFGPARNLMDVFFMDHSNWYINTPMMASWLLMISIAVMIFAYMNALMHYQHYRFILDDNAFHLHRGLFFIRETTIPYHQISNVHIARPYHFRLLGVSELDIVTAADKSLSHTETKKTKEFLVPVIDARVARLLADQLVEYASRKKKGEKLTIEEDGDIEEEDDGENTDDSSTNDNVEDISVEEYDKKNSATRKLRITDENAINDEFDEIEDISELEHYKG